ncbi:hypothetical protein JCM10213_007324 [Rhodosporidiobolus nylandii]
MSRVSSAAATPTATALPDSSQDVSSIALPRQPSSTQDQGADASTAADPTPVTFSSPAAADTDAPTSTAAAEDSSSAADATSPSASPARTSTRAPRPTNASVSPPAITVDPLSDAAASIRTVVASLSLPSGLLTSPLPLTLGLPTLISLDSSIATALPGPTQGFATSVRRLPDPTETGVSASPPSDQPHPSATATRAAERAASYGKFTGLCLAGLVLILLLLLLAPKLKACCFSKRKRKDERGVSSNDVWAPGGSAATFPRRGEKDDDEVSWFSGSTADGGLNEKDEKPTSSASLTTLVEHAGGDDGSSGMKENVAGIGRRNTLKSIVNVPRDVPPPQAEFVAFPRTPTIIYSPPPAEAAQPFPFSPPRRILTPQSFPSTPTTQSFPRSPSRTPQPLRLDEQYPPSTPPLSGLYSQGEWSRILHSPPILSPPGTIASSVASPDRSRSTTPHSDYPYADSATDDDASVYSRPSMVLPAPPPLAAGQRPPLPRLPMKLEGLAAAAAAARSRALSEVGGMESFPVTPSTECAEESVVGAGWRRAR